MQEEEIKRKISPCFWNYYGGGRVGTNKVTRDAEFIIGHTGAYQYANGGRNSKVLAFFRITSLKEIR